MEGCGRSWLGGVGIRAVQLAELSLPMDGALRAALVHERTPNRSDHPQPHVCIDPYSRDRWVSKPSSSWYEQKLNVPRAAS